MLLGDDRNDPRAARGQMIGMLVMGAVLILWMYLFPPQVPPPADPAAPVATQTEAPKEAPASGIRVLPAAVAPETLPPAAEPAADPASDEVALENGALKLVFTKVGARLKAAKVILGPGGIHSQDLLSPELDPKGVLPLGLRFDKRFLADELDQRRWDAQVDTANQAVTFSLALPGTATLTKRFQLNGQDSVLQVEVGYTNTSAAPQSLGEGDKYPAFALNWGPEVTSGDTNKGLHQEIIWRVAGENEVLPVSSLEPIDGLEGYAMRRPGAEWIALASPYFVVALKPVATDPNGSVWAEGELSHTYFRIGVGTPPFQAAPGEVVQRSFQVYIGPKEKDALAAAWAGLESTWIFYHDFIWSKSLGHFMDLFSKLLLGILNWFHDNVYANYGVAIIFLTVLVRLAVLPLTIKSMASMKKMQKLQPEMEELRTKYKDNPQEQQAKLMELYRERGVNPVSGCFPLLLQMPVFFALFRMLWTAVELRRAPFGAWITDLSEPDRLYTFAEPISLVFFDLHSINLLPLLMALVMWASTKLMPTTGPGMSPEQKMVMNIMPVMFSLFCYTQAAGLSLYIITSTVLGMAQSYFVNRIEWDVDVSKQPAKPGATKKHWYAAALEKKKQLEKDQKEIKKASRDAILRGDAPSGNDKKNKKNK